MAFLLLYNCWLLFKLPYISMQWVPYVACILKETSSWNPTIEFQRIMEYQMNFNLNLFKLTIFWILWIFTEPVHLDWCSLKPLRRSHSNWSRFKICCKTAFYDNMHILCSLNTASGVWNWYGQFLNQLCCRDSYTLDQEPFYFSSMNSCLDGHIYAAVKKLI